MLPLITENMYFDTVLKAIENVLKTESDNQISLGGTGWKTVRERFDPWTVTVDNFFPGVANVTWSASNFPGSGNNTAQKSGSTFDIDCYASREGFDDNGIIIPKDQRTADVLHSIVSKVYFVIMSGKNADLGLIPGTIDRPWVSNIVKFIPTESNIPISGVLAARITCNVKFEEIPPNDLGVNLNEINVKSDTPEGGLVDQTFEVGG